MIAHQTLQYFELLYSELLTQMSFVSKVNVQSFALHNSYIVNIININAIVYIQYVCFLYGAL